MNKVYERQPDSFSEEDGLEMFVHGDESITIDRNEWIEAGSPDFIEATWRPHDWD